MIILFPEDKYWCSLSLAAIFLSFEHLYECCLARNSLALSRELFEGLDVLDVVKCMNAAISTLENTEGLLRTANNDPRELLRVLKLFHNGSQWEKLRDIQLHELKVFPRGWLKKAGIDLRGEVDAELLAAASKIEALSGKITDYGQKLENLEYIHQVAESKALNLKALAASFTIQIKFYSTVLKSPANPKKLHDKPLVPSTSPHPTTMSFFPSLPCFDRPEHVPSNVLYDAESFYDCEFPKVDFQDSCTWFRAKDIGPSDMELALFSDNCEDWIE